MRWNQWMETVMHIASEGHFRGWIANPKYWEAAFRSGKTPRQAVEIMWGWRRG